MNIDIQMYDKFVLNLKSLQYFLEAFISYPFLEFMSLSFTTIVISMLYRYKNTDKPIFFTLFLFVSVIISLPL